MNCMAFLCRPRKCAKVVVLCRHRKCVRDAVLLCSRRKCAAHVVVVCRRRKCVGVAVWCRKRKCGRLATRGGTKVSAERKCERCAFAVYLKKACGVRPVVSPKKVCRSRPMVSPKRMCGKARAVVSSEKVCGGCGFVLVWSKKECVCRGCCAPRSQVSSAVAVGQYVLVVSRRKVWPQGLRHCVGVVFQQGSCAYQWGTMVVCVCPVVKWKKEEPLGHRAEVWFVQASRV